MLVVFLTAMLQLSAAQEKVVGVFYFAPILGHVHQSPQRTSASLTTIQCGHPLKVIEDAQIAVSDDWALVRVADWKGFVWRSHLAATKPACLQSRYPKFFDSLNLDLAELYYWGRLSDHWATGEVKP